MTSNQPQFVVFFIYLLDWHRGNFTLSWMREKVRGRDRPAQASMVMHRAGKKYKHDSEAARPAALWRRTQGRSGRDAQRLEAGKE